MESFTIYPVLGIKNDVPADHPSMFKAIGQNAAETHCTESNNVQYHTLRKACGLSPGRTVYSNTATTTTTNCQGIHELYDSSGNRVIYIFMADGSTNGRIFRYDSSRDPVRISDVVGHAGAVEFASGDSDFYCPITYGDYMVFTDRGEHTPYYADHNDTVVDKLISSGTEYKFRYLEVFQRRIIGAYSDQSNGHLEIRWTNTNPGPGATCAFAAANQLLVTNSDPITGIKRMGRNLCFVYCENSIHRLTYLGNYNTPFGLSTVLDTIGAANYHSIVDIGNMHYFYSIEYGFCEFNGQDFRPISDDIKTTINTISAAYIAYIQGTHLPNDDEIVWTVPVNASSSANTLLFYNYKTGAWRRKDISMRCVSQAQIYQELTWNDLSDYGYDNWYDFGGLRWADLATQNLALVYSNQDGHLYFNEGAFDNGNGMLGGRTEPVLDLGNSKDRTLILEIWFNLAKEGNYTMSLFHRSGDTVGQCVKANWVGFNALDCNEVVNPVFYADRVGRYHQFKWSSLAANGEGFSVSDIQIKYVLQGRY